MTTKDQIKILRTIELEAIALAQRCSDARRVLEQESVTAPASRKGGLSEARVVKIKSTRRKNLLSKAR